MVQLSNDYAATRSNKLIVLDRDGVINVDSDQFVKSAEEWRAIPGSLEAIARLNHAGYRVVVATNQSGIGRGLFDMATLNEMHTKMNRELGKVGGRVDALFYCPHTADQKCDCRKPKPGMLEAIGQRFGSSMEGVVCVGDSLRDLEAATAVGARPILVLTGKGEKTLALDDMPEGTEVYPDLAFTVAKLLAEEQG